MVHIQAITIRLAVSQCTDFMPLVSPTPIIEPEIVCDELTGMPKMELIINVNAPDVSAQKPRAGSMRAMS